MWLILNRKRRSKSNLITYSHSDSHIADQFRTIRTNIKFLPGERKNRVFLISSPGKDEGKSTISSNLAVSIAQQNEKVLLIDTNVREPVIQNIFNISNNIGLTDVLTKKATFNQAVYTTGIGQLHVLTSGSTLLNPSELLGNEEMTALLEASVEDYHIVLIDSPNVLNSTETRVLANQCDGVILVLQRGKTELEEIAESHRILSLAHATLVGAIINEK